MLAGTDLHVPLVLGRSPVARGRVTFGGATPPSPPTANVIQFVDENPEVGAVGSRGAQIRSDWTFEASDTFGRRKIRVQPPRGWRLASIRVGDADLTDAVFDFEAGDISGIEIALTNRLAEAAVVVKDRGGRDTRAATVVMFAEDRAKWGPDSRFVAAIRADASGRFIARTLPPGRYHAAAVEGLEPGDEMDPAVMERLQRSAASVVLREGETVAIELSSVEL